MVLFWSSDLFYGIVLYLIIWQLNLQFSTIFLFIHPFAFRPQCYYDYIIMFSCYLNSITFKVILCKVTSKYVHQKMTWHSYIRRKCHTWSTSITYFVWYGYRRLNYDQLKCIHGIRRSDLEHASSIMSFKSHQGCIHNLIACGIFGQCIFLHKFWWYEII